MRYERKRVFCRVLVEQVGEANMEERVLRLERQRSRMNVYGKDAVRSESVLGEAFCELRRRELVAGRNRYSRLRVLCFFFLKRRGGAGLQSSDVFRSGDERRFPKQGLCCSRIAFVLRKLIVGKEIEKAVPRAEDERATARERVAREREERVKFLV